VQACEGRIATITKLEKKEQREEKRRCSTTSRPCSARAKQPLRILGQGAPWAQRSGFYEEHKALTYPRTNSRYLPSDMVEEIKPTAELVGVQPEYSKAAGYVTALDVLAAQGRVVNDEKVTDHHAIIPTRLPAPARQDGLRRPAHLRHGGQALSSPCSTPRAVFENTRVETTVPASGPERDGGLRVSARAASSCWCRGWRGVYERDRDRVLADGGTGRRTR